MKLIVDKLGRIDHAEFDVRNLTVFVGPNGTNKTWAAYALYGLACALARPRFTQGSPQMIYDEKLLDITQAAAEGLLSRLADRSISEIGAEIHRRDVVGSIDQPVGFSLDAGMVAEILQVDRSIVEGASARLLLGPSEFARSAYDVLKINVNNTESFVEATLEKQGNAPLVARRSFSRIVDPAEDDGIGFSLKSIAYEFVGKLIFDMFDSAVPFPAERKAIVSMQVAALRNLFQHRDAEIASFASPAADFLWMIQNLGNRPVNDKEESDFKTAATLLEDKVLQGKTEFSKEKSGILRPIRYIFGDGQELGMHAASSMVRALAGLDLYLKTIAKRGSIIVIDEPEMNAHPEAQLKIVEFLAILANSGLRVVFTTHSPYIVDHLSNLMMASRVAEGSRQTVADRFKLGRPEAFIAPENVSAYLFRENGNVENVLDRREASIDLGTFGEQTEFMVNLIHTILDATPDESQPIEEIRHAV